MSKVAAILFTVAGASVLSVGGVWMLKNRGGKIEEDSAIKEFKTDKGDDCVKSLFGTDGVEMNGLGSDVTDIPNPSANYFGAAPTAESSEVTSCLMVEWNKKTFTDSKWKGTFKWSWSFKNTNKGFIIFSVATAKEDKKLGLSGVVYLVDKPENGKWKVSHKKEVGGKEIDKTSFETNFPKAKSTLSVVKDALTFAPSQSDLDKICDSSCKGDGTNASQTPQKVTWNWKKTGGSEKVAEWSEDLKGWDHIFDLKTFDLGNQLTNFTGKWEKAANS